MLSVRIVCPAESLHLASEAAVAVFDTLVRDAIERMPDNISVRTVDFINALRRTGIAPTPRERNVLPYYRSVGWQCIETASAYSFLAEPADITLPGATVLESLATPALVSSIPTIAVYLFDQLLRTTLARAKIDTDWHFVPQREYRSTLELALGGRVSVFDDRWFHVHDAYAASGLWDVRAQLSDETPEDERGYYFRPTEAVATEDDVDEKHVYKGIPELQDMCVRPFATGKREVPSRILKAVDTFLRARMAEGHAPCITADQLRIVIGAKFASRNAITDTLDALCSYYSVYWDAGLDVTDDVLALTLRTPVMEAVPQKPAPREPDDIDTAIDAQLDAIAERARFDEVDPADVPLLESVGADADDCKETPPAQ